MDALGAGETLLMLWPGTKDPPPPSPVHALRQTLADAVGSGRGGAPHAFFVAVVGDAVQLLRLGRSAVLLALVDAARMASRARSAAEDLEDDAAPKRMRQVREAGRGPKHWRLAGSALLGERLGESALEGQG